MGRGARAASAPPVTTAPGLTLQKSTPRASSPSAACGIRLLLRNSLSGHQPSATQRYPSSSRATTRTPSSRVLAIPGKASALAGRRMVAAFGRERKRGTGAGRTKSGRVLSVRAAAACATGFAISARESPAHASTRKRYAGFDCTTTGRVPMQTSLPERAGEFSLSRRPVVSADDRWRSPLSGSSTHIAAQGDGETTPCS
jgi:hypothetical protein